MKYLILTILLLSIFLISSCQNNIIVGCTAEAKICPDGSGVGRSGPNCKFKECSDLIECGVDKPNCPNNYQCYTTKTGNYCITGVAPEICMINCGNSACQLLESYPIQIKCNN